MAALQPGMLLKMLEHIDSSFKVAGEHRSVLLQVIGIVPALAGQELWPKLGFHVRVSDATHSMYVSLSPEHDGGELVLSGKLQLGQFLHVERLEQGLPFPRLVGIKPVSVRNPSTRNPEELAATVIQIPQKSIAEVQAFIKKNQISTRRDGRNMVGRTTEDGLQSKWEPFTPASQRKVYNKLALMHLEKPILNGSDYRVAPRRTSLKVLSENYQQDFSACQTVGKSLESRPLDKKQAVRNPSPRLALRVQPPSNTFVHADDYLPRYKAFLFEKTPVKSHPRSTVEGQNVHRIGIPAVINGPSERRLHGVKETVTMVPVRYRRTPSSSISSRKDSLPGRNTMRDEAGKRCASTGRVVPDGRNVAAGRHNSMGLASDCSSRKSWDCVPVAIARQNWDKPEAKVSSASSQKHAPLIASKKQHGTQLSSLQARNGDAQQSICAAPSLRSSVQKLPTIHHRKWTDGSVSWDCLSVSLAALAKDASNFKRRASLAAAQALQEASAAESVIRNVSMFAEMRSSSRPEFPREPMEKYFSLCSSLRKATTISDALVKAYQLDKLQELSSLSKITDEAPGIRKEKLKSAASWVTAALSTDLACVLSADKQRREPDHIAHRSSSSRRYSALGSVANSQASESIRSLQSSLSNRRSPSPSPMIRQSLPSRAQGRTNTSALSRASVRKQSSEQETGASVLPHVHDGVLFEDALQIVSKFSKDMQVEDDMESNWVPGKRVQVVAELAKQLQYESQKWFFKYMEEALDCGFHFHRVSAATRKGANRKVLKDSEALASAFPHLKQVNDWIGELDYETLDSNMLEVLDRLKKKICGFLFQHVETASTAIRMSI